MVEGRAMGGMVAVGDKAKGNLTNCSIASKTESILKDHDTLVSFRNKDRKMKLISRGMLKLKKETEK